MSGCVLAALAEHHPGLEVLIIGTRVAADKNWPTSVISRCFTSAARVMDMQASHAAAAAAASFCKAPTFTNIVQGKHSVRTVDRPGHQLCRQRHALLDRAAGLACLG